MRFTVTPVVSLVADGHTKFLATHDATATSAAIHLTTVDYGATLAKCTGQKQKYYDTGIRDYRDIAYLLYRRLIQAESSNHQSMAQCMVHQIGPAALLIEKYMPKLAEDHRITTANVEDIIAEETSYQPHNRPRRWHHASEFGRAS